LGGGGVALLGLVRVWQVMVDLAVAGTSLRRQNFRLKGKAG